MTVSGLEIITMMVNLDLIEIDNSVEYQYSGLKADD